MPDPSLIYCEFFNGWQNLKDCQNICAMFNDCEQALKKLGLWMREDKESEGE